jgi:peptidyl-prolyl cis-trans isomerase SurA
MQRILAAILSTLLIGPAINAQARLINGVNVVVNDAVITYQEVEAAIAPFVEVLMRQVGHQPQVFEQRVQELRADTLEGLIERQLILHEYKTAGYNLPETFVDEAIQRRIRQDFGDQATLTRTLQARGMTREAFRQQLREDIIIGALRSKHVSSEKILISPFKIETYYQENQEQFKVEDQVRLRMIVLNKNGGRPGDSARRLAEEIHQKLEEGASFAEMASVYSDAAQRAQGGDRGWVDRTFFRKELSDAAFALQPGQHSAVIDLPEACYLLKVEEARAAHVKPLEIVRQDVENTLKQQEAARLHQRWIGRLKEKSFIRYY